MVEIPMDQGQKMRTKKTTKLCKACGLNTHSRITSKECPYNKRNQSTLVDTGGKQENFQLSNDTLSDDPLPSTDSTSSNDSSIMEDLFFSCTCNTLTKAHKADCPLNSRNRYAKRVNWLKHSIRKLFNWVSTVLFTGAAWHIKTLYAESYKCCQETSPQVI